MRRNRSLHACENHLPYVTLCVGGDWVSLYV